MSTYGTGRLITTAQAFIAHWTEVNAALEKSPLALQNGYTLASLVADRAALQAATDAIVPFANGVKGAAFVRDERKTALRERLAQFRSAIAALLPGTTYAQIVPTLPDISANEARFLTPMHHALAVWRSIEGKSLHLAGGYDINDFAVDLEQLREAYDAVSAAQFAVKSARKGRDLLVHPLTERLRQYRQAVRARLVPGSALLRNVPQYT